MEDVIGAGAVLDALEAHVPVEPATDAARIAVGMFRASREKLPEVLAEGAGGKHVRAAGLGADIDFSARLNVFDVVGVVKDDPLRVVRGVE